MAKELKKVNVVSLVGRLLRAIFTQRNTYAERDTHTTKKLNY